MGPQRHKIMRQVLEVRAGSLDEARLLDSGLRRAFYERILPQIDRVCTDLSAPERIHRIDRLEVDLGEMPLEALESALGDRFETAFGRELGAAISRAPQADADLELLDYFFRTGALPWWAESGERAELEASLDRLIRHNPGGLRATLRGAPDQDRMRRRLVRAFPDHVLDQLLGVVAPSVAAVCPGLGNAGMVALEGARRPLGVPAHSARNIWWEEAFRAASGTGGATTFDASGWFQGIVVRVARRLGVDYPSLAAELQRDIETDASRRPVWMRDAVDGLSRPRSDGALELEPFEGDAIARERDLQEVRVSDFSDADRLYVRNGGLVILWPFLQRFFGRLGLLEGKAFKDDAAVQRAVGLLQYIAAADDAPSESALPLNKILCGIPPEEVFDFGPELTAEERSECDGLLAAVITQAGVLNDMSLAGFRGSFLLREAQLGVRDGNWLLRVERRTHDIVLDRFPWSVHFVKLPWMQAMMQVEW